MSKRETSTGQLPLVLPVDASLDRDDLIVGEANAMAVDMIDRWPDWAAPLVILAGPSGSGKTHLAHIWAEKSAARIFKASNLDDSAVDNRDQLNFVLEDVVAGALDETTLFHLINTTRTKGGYGLLTSTSWPQSWNIELPDLMSRLRAATLVELQEPDDALLRATLVKLFADRQIGVEQPVIDYLVTRMERSIATASRIVEALDHEALARGKPVTRPMAVRILEDMESYGLLI